MSGWGGRGKREGERGQKERDGGIGGERERERERETIIAVRSHVPWKPLISESRVCLWVHNQKAGW